MSLVALNGMKERTQCEKAQTKYSTSLINTLKYFVKLRKNQVFGTDIKHVDKQLNHDKLFVKKWSNT
jgi:hypothetical protein